MYKQTKSNQNLIECVYQKKKQIKSNEKQETKLKKFNH